MVTNIAERVTALEGKASLIDKVAWVLSVLAVVFGLSGAKIWQDLSMARADAATAQKEAAAAVEQLRTQGREVLASFKPEFTLQLHKQTPRSWLRA